MVGEEQCHAGTGAVCVCVCMNMNVGMNVAYWLRPRRLRSYNSKVLAV